MTERISYRALRDILANTGRGRSASSGGKPRKYRNIPTVYGDRLYDSAREARHAAELDLLKQAGEIAGWIPQVSLPVPGTKRRMVLDFLVLMPDGEVKFQDTKGGVVTRDWQLKRELVERAYGITIEIVR